ncbi:MAG: hypothetical protein M1546_26395 [Chloroflexi bacterium]|nr:hypothetical protein [Chloroflexota bacterium]
MGKRIKIYRVIEALEEIEIDESDLMQCANAARTMGVSTAQINDYQDSRLLPRLQYSRDINLPYGQRLPHRFTLKSAVEMAKKAREGRGTDKDPDGIKEKV